MFIDSIDCSKIKRMLELEIFKGVTTNPTLLLLGKESRDKQIKNILKTGANLVFVQVVGYTVEEMFDDYEKIRQLDTGNQIGIKIPLNREGVKCIHKIKRQDNKRVLLGTAIYSTEQGIIGALAGCDYLAPYVNRMQVSGIDPKGVIKEIKKFIVSRDLKTKIMAASFKTSEQVLSALISGADTVTVPIDIAESFLYKPLAINAIEVFNDHGKKLKRY